MNPFVKALRRLVPEEIKTLLEKVDSFDTLTDSSSYHTREFVRHAKLTRLERFLLRDALSRIERRDTMVRAMELVIHAPSDPYIVEGSLLARGLNQSITGAQGAQLKADVERSRRIFEEAEQARQAALAQENLQRKKVTVRVKPAAQ